MRRTTATARHSGFGACCRFAGPRVRRTRCVALVAVERNNHGSGVLAYLDAVERYARVYEQTGVAGWLTSASSKPALISRMGALLVESPWLFLSKRLLEECRTFVSHPGGRTGAAVGAHDDCLMAMALGQAVRAERMQTGSNRMRAA